MFEIVPNFEQELVQQTRNLEKATQELELGLAQAGLLAAGIGDPTPITDTLNAGMSFSRGEVVGLSQLYIGPAPEIIGAASGIELAVHNFVNEFAHKTQRWDCALDLFVKPGRFRDWDVTLIEINPLIP
ncbi:MAG: hypothetical protein P8163_13325 [Candidatus Thiodiazotropha sp.]